MVYSEYLANALWITPSAVGHQLLFFEILALYAAIEIPLDQQVQGIIFNLWSFLNSLE